MVGDLSIHASRFVVTVPEPMARSGTSRKQTRWDGGPAAAIQWSRNAIRDEDLIRQWHGSGP